MAAQVPRVGGQAVGSRPLLSRRRPVVPIAHMCIHGTGVNAVQTRVLVVLRSGAARRSVETETDREPIEPRRRRSLLALPAPPAGGPATTRSAAAAGAREGFPFVPALFPLGPAAAFGWSVFFFSLSIIFSHLET